MRHTPQSTTATTAENATLRGTPLFVSVNIPSAVRSSRAIPLTQMPCHDGRQSDGLGGAKELRNAQRDPDARNRGKGFRIG